VPKNPVFAALLCPTTVTVHYYGYMFRQLGQVYLLFQTHLKLERLNAVLQIYFKVGKDIQIAIR
jgi:hypothetical protein